MANRSAYRVWSRRLRKSTHVSNGRASTASGRAGDGSPGGRAAERGRGQGGGPRRCVARPDGSGPQAVTHRGHLDGGRDRRLFRRRPRAGHDPRSNRPGGAEGDRALTLAPWGGLWLRSLLKGEPLREAIGELFPARRFEELTIPLTVTAVDLDSGNLVLFGAAGEPALLLDALWASCALPVFYPPVLLGGRRLVDGGL